MRVAAVVLVLAAVDASAGGQRVKVWVSSNGGDRMAAKEDREFETGKDSREVKADSSSNEISGNKISTTHEVTYTGTYWYLAHFSKFVKPGAVRVGTSGGMKGVRVMAFASSDGGYVVELLNSLREAAKVNVEFERKVVGVEVAGRSITTLTW
jgi:O-glycosyl hydrolase